MRVNIKRLNGNDLPKYATKGSAGMDLYAAIEGVTYISPGERKLIHTGIAIELPEGYEAQIRPRSGMALKRGISIVNSPGTIDSDFIGEIGVILINHGHYDHLVYKGDKIAQMVINKVERAEWCEVEELTKTKRGDGGFGHTGK